MVDTTIDLTHRNEYHYEWFRNIIPPSGYFSFFREKSPNEKRIFQTDHELIGRKVETTHNVSVNGMVRLSGRQEKTSLASKKATIFREFLKVAGGERWYVVANFYGRSRAYVSFQVRLTPELKERLLRRSYETGQSQVAIVNAALEYYLDNVAGIMPGTKQEPPGNPEG